VIERERETLLAKWSKYKIEKGSCSESRKQKQSPFKLVTDRKPVALYPVPETFDPFTAKDSVIIFAGVGYPRILARKQMQTAYYAVRIFWVEKGLRFGSTAAVPHDRRQISPL
jgi:hypothetical protein